MRCTYRFAYVYVSIYLYSKKTLIANQSSLDSKYTSAPYAGLFGVPIGALYIYKVLSFFLMVLYRNKFLNFKELKLKKIRNLFLRPCLLCAHSYTRLFAYTWKLIHNKMVSIKYAFAVYCVFVCIVRTLFLKFRKQKFSFMVTASCSNAFSINIWMHTYTIRVSC